MKHLLILICCLTTIFLSSCNQEDFAQSEPNYEVEQTSNSETIATTSYRVSIDDALASADIILSKIDDTSTRSSKSRNVKNISYVTEQKTRSGETDTLLYVVNYEDNQGFAILGADVRTAPIYCISNEGEINLSDTIHNKGLALLYNSYIHDASYSTSNFAKFSNNGFVIPPGFDPYPEQPDWGERIITYYQDTKPKLSKYVSRWGQDKPFNSECKTGPLSALQYHKVGCVPLACAQIMSYYQWPVSYNGVTLNWDELSTWPEAYYTLMCPYWLAAFLNDVGITLNKYQDESSDNTLVSDPNVIQNFHKFGYQNIGDKQVLTHANASKAIENGPILVTGEPYANSVDDGHAWVMDGYLYYKEVWNAIANPSHTLYYQLYHCVWGWYGKNNGYFTCPDNGYITTHPSQYAEDDLKETNPNVANYVFDKLYFWSNFKPVK